MSDRRAASEVARSLDAPAISAQAWALRGRILEAASVIRDVRLIEAHPELSFAEMTGAPIAFPKRTWNGLAARLHALNAHGIAFPDAIDGSGGSLPPTDLVDAAAVAWTASRAARGMGRRFPPTADGTDDVIWA